MKQIRKQIILLGIVVFAAACTLAEPPIYSVTEPGINFSSVGLPHHNPDLLPSYPDDLRMEHDFGNFPLFIRRGFAGFSPMHQLEVGVQTQGFTITEDLRFVLTADSVTSGAGTTIQLRNYYVVEAFEGRARAPFEAKVIPPGTTTTMVLGFDTERSQFRRGIRERQYHRVILRNTTGSGLALSIPDGEIGWGLGMWGWSWFEELYGNFSVTKMKFMALVLIPPTTLNPTPALLGPRLNNTSTQVNLLRTRLEEYKQWHAENPLRYPALYEDDEGTWISFP